MKKNNKYLGSLLNTKKDIKRGKELTIDPYKTFESIFSSKHVSEKAKIRIFAKYIESIVMYNSELWTLTQTLENSIYRCVSKEAAKKNHEYQMAKDDLQ